MDVEQPSYQGVKCPNVAELENLAKAAEGIRRLSVEITRQKRASSKIGHSILLYVKTRYLIVFEDDMEQREPI